MYAHMHVINELRRELHNCRNYLRMDENSYTKLLEHIFPLLQNEDIIMRLAITSYELLSTTLRYLAAGRNYENLKFSARISVESSSVKNNFRNLQNNNWCS